MQQSPQMMPMMPSFPPTNITTEQIQKYLDENKKLILAILDNQNLGKLAECAQFQAQLQKNLMYLAAIADAQPQAPAIPSQQGGFYMQQHPQAAAAAAAAMAQQPGLYPPRGPLQFGSPHQMPDPQHHQQQMQGQMGMRSIGGGGGGGPNSGMHPLHHSESGRGGGGSGGGAPAQSGGSKPDGSGADASGAGHDGKGTSGGKHGGGGDGEKPK